MVEGKRYRIRIEAPRHVVFGGVKIRLFFVPV